ncbi:hypothetical protein [Streptomyces sp. bgisy153]|uniref:hypothetical protein n=1 Tax=Streptomyces sp. bgisy153 TaxID=3413793 RepID=UPI003D708800
MTVPFSAEVPSIEPPETPGDPSPSASSSSVRSPEAARAVPDVKAAEGRDPMGRLPGSWNDALRDVARGQVRTTGGEWQRLTRGRWTRHPSQRAMAALLALGLIVESDDVMGHPTGGGDPARHATLSRTGVARFDHFGIQIPERARALALNA